MSAQAPLLPFLFEDLAYAVARYGGNLLKPLDRWAINNAADTQRKRAKRGKYKRNYVAEYEAKKKRALKALA